jgi:lipopolysaccharide export system permease protein
VLKIPGIRIIDQSILRELGLTFALSLAVMTLALFIQQMLRFSDVFLKTGIPFGLFLRFLFYVLPFFLVLTIPIAALLASLLTFSRLSTDREYTAIMSAGISPYRLLRPTLYAGLLLSGIALWISLVIQPWSGTALKKDFYEALKQQRNFGLQEGVFNSLFNRVLYIEKISPPHSLQGLLISDQRSKSKTAPAVEKQVITAESGVIRVDPSTSGVFLELRDGGIHRFSRDAYQVIQFSSFMIKLGEDDPTRRGAGFIKEQRAMTLPQYRAFLSELREDPSREIHYREVLLEYHRKFSLPASAFIFALLGAPVGVMIRSSSRIAGFGLGILIIVFYYLLYIVSEFMTQSAIVSSAAAAWIPNGVTALLMIWLVWRMARK